MSVPMNNECVNECGSEWLSKSIGGVYLGLGLPETKPPTTTSYVSHFIFNFHDRKKQNKNKKLSFH